MAVMVVVGDVKKAVKGFFRSLLRSEKCDQCALCQKTMADSDDLLCSQICAFRYWAQYRKEKGGHICMYPGCGKPCYVDANNKSAVFDFCGRTHAKEYKDLVKQMSQQGLSSKRQCFKRMGCGYLDCPKPRYVDGNTGVVLDFCGKMHATMYKELQRGGPVYSSTHQATVYTTRGGNTTGTSENFTGPIHFYNSNEKYYEFTNFYERPISIDNKKWNTSEHYFQAQKFVGTPYLEKIRCMQRPRDAFDLSRDPTVSRWLRSDWEKVKLDVMYKALLVKFSQHKDLKALLLQTRNRELVEHTSNDSYWGDGGDGRGQNNLGKLLMRVREVLRPQGHNTSVATDGEDVEMVATNVPDLIDTGSKAVDMGKEGDKKTSSVASDGDNAKDGSGSYNIISGNACSGICVSIDNNEGNGPSYKDANSGLDSCYSEFVWGESEEKQLLKYPAEDPVDSSDGGDAAEKNDSAVDSLLPASVIDEKNVGNGQKPSLSGMPTRHEQNSAEPMEVDGNQSRVYDPLWS